jgi:hypothetical protein
VRLLAAPVVAGLTFVAVLDGIGGQLQTRYRASRTRPRNRIPPVAFLFIAVGIVLTVLCIYAVVQNDAGGNGWMYGP